MANQRVFDKTVRKRTYSVLVENEPGVLARIAGLFSARGFNIASLAVGETLDPEVSQMTIVAEGTSAQLEQINKQLNKIIPVITVRELHPDDHISRELLLLKLKKSDDAKLFMKENRSEHEWKIIDESPEHFVIQVVVGSGEVAKVIDELRSFGLIELCRTGEIALSKKYKLLVPSDSKKGVHLNG